MTIAVAVGTAGSRFCRHASPLHRRRGGAHAVLSGPSPPRGFRGCVLLAPPFRRYVFYPASCGASIFPAWLERVPGFLSSVEAACPVFHSNEILVDSPRRRRKGGSYDLSNGDGGSVAPTQRTLQALLRGRSCLLVSEGELAREFVPCPFYSPVPPASGFSGQLYGLDLDLGRLKEHQSPGSCHPTATVRRRSSSPVSGARWRDGGARTGAEVSEGGSRSRDSGAPLYQLGGYELRRRCSCH